jgi:hypothetical protein
VDGKKRILGEESSFHPPRMPRPKALARGAART